MNGDNVQSDDEAGLAGVAVQVLSTIGDPSIVTLRQSGGADQTAKTSVNGLYLFAGVANGGHEVGAVLPLNFAPITPLTAAITVDGVHGLAERFSIRPNLPNQSPVVQPLPTSPGRCRVHAVGGGDPFPQPLCYAGFRAGAWFMSGKWRSVVGVPSSLHPLDRFLSIQAGARYAGGAPPGLSR